MLPLLLPLLLPAAAAPQSGPDSGIEALTAALEARTAERRTQAREAWEAHGAAFLLQPDEDSEAPLLARAPEIQEPLLGALETELAHGEEAPAANRVEALVDLLGRTMNAWGAEQLTALLPRLSLTPRLLALRQAAACGSRRALEVAEQWLREGEASERQTALQALLAHAPLPRMEGYLQPAAIRALDPDAVASAMQALSMRELPEGFRLPPSLYSAELDPRVAPGVLALLAKAPAEESEEYLVELVSAGSRPLEHRKAALPLIEEGADRFRWRRAPRALRELVEESARDPLAESAAWCLHRMGEKAGDKFLLAGPLAGVDNRPKSPQAHVALATVYLDLGEHTSAYREFKTAFELAEDLPAMRRAGAGLNLEPLIWVTAARAAAGARRTREAGDWLETARLSPEELAPYRDLPEFEPYLSRPRFKRLFGLD